MGFHCKAVMLVWILHVLYAHQFSIAGAQGMGLFVTTWGCRLTRKVWHTYWIMFSITHQPLRLNSCTAVQLVLYLSHVSSLSSCIMFLMHPSFLYTSSTTCFSHHLSQSLPTHYPHSLSCFSPFSTIITCPHQTSLCLSCCVLLPLACLLLITSMSSFLPASFESKPKHYPLLKAQTHHKCQPHQILVTNSDHCSLSCATHAFYSNVVNWLGIPVSTPQLQHKMAVTKIMVPVVPVVNVIWIPTLPSTIATMLLESWLCFDLFV